MSPRRLLVSRGSRSSAIDAGIAFVLHGWGKVADVTGFAAAQGVPVALGAAAAYVQFVGGLLPVVALLTPLAALGIGVFADVRLALKRDGRAALTLRPGRQLLTYGSGRLIDVRYGPNVLQTFDAAKAFIETDGWRVDAFYARPVDHRPGEFDDRTDDRQSLWSLYGTLNPSGAPLGLDLYYIGYLNGAAVFAERAGRELRHTLGARLFGEARGWGWNFEFIYQFGGGRRGRRGRRHLRVVRCLRHRLHV